MDQQQTVEDLTLMLMLLTSWSEGTGQMRRCWKGYDFDVLDQFGEKSFISSGRGAKPAYLTEEGERRARELLRRLDIPFGDG